MLSVYIFPNNSINEMFNIKALHLGWCFGMVLGLLPLQKFAGSPCWHCWESGINGSFMSYYWRVHEQTSLHGTREKWQILWNLIIIINGATAQSRALASLTGFVTGILRCGLSAPRSSNLISSWNAGRLETLSEYIFAPQISFTQRVTAPWTDRTQGLV
jgi:hypothetical protein